MLHTLVDGKTSRNVLAEKVDKQIMFDDELEIELHFMIFLFKNVIKFSELNSITFWWTKTVRKSL